MLLGYYQYGVFFVCVCLQSNPYCHFIHLQTLFVDGLVTDCSLPHALCWRMLAHDILFINTMTFNMFCYMALC